MKEIKAKIIVSSTDCPINNGNCLNCKYLQSVSPVYTGVLTSVRWINVECSCKEGGFNE